MARLLILYFVGICFSILCLTNIKAYAQTSSSKKPLREITVSAEARSIRSVSPTELTYLLDAEAKNATEATKIIEQKLTKTKAVVPERLKSKFRERGRTISSATSKGGPVSRNASVKMQAFLALQLDPETNLGNLIDSLLNAGASSITEIEYDIPDESSVKLSAIKQATEKAKIKAENVAKTLSVRLGTILSQTVTEEPAGATLRGRMQKGGYAAQYQEKATNVYVTARYQVFAK